MLSFSAVAPLDQSAEQLTLDQRVLGSSSRGCTDSHKDRLSETLSSLLFLDFDDPSSRVLKLPN